MMRCDLIVMAVVAAVFVAATVQGTPVPTHAVGAGADVSGLAVSLRDSGNTAYCVQGGAVQVAHFAQGAWSNFTALVPAEGPTPPMHFLTVTPVVTPVNVTGTTEHLYAMADDGQVYAVATAAGPNKTWVRAGTTLPGASSKLPGAPLQQPLVAVERLGVMHLIVRSLNGTVYWAALNASATPSLKFTPIGHEAAASDPAVTPNHKMERLEAFMIGTDSRLRRSHLNKGDHVWIPGWKQLDDSQPGFANIAPLAFQAKEETGIGGVLEVYAVGLDKTLYTVRQQSCDRTLKECTWAIGYHAIADNLPVNSAAGPAPLPMAIGYNIHFGFEIFVVASEGGKLFHLYQLESRGDWSDLAPAAGPAGPSLVSAPFMSLSPSGWWQVDAMTSPSDATRITSQPRTLEVSDPSGWVSGTNLTVNWDIAADQATHMDWLAVYKADAEDTDYLDFQYVQGTLDPLHDARPKGQVEFGSHLPEGAYEIRYNVRKQFVSVLSAAVTVTESEPAMSEAKQLYLGMVEGLGSGPANFNFEKCVQDGNMTVETFKQSFIAFEDRKVYLALHLFAEGLDDFYFALNVCNETGIAQRMEKFLKDLIACTSSACEAFIIDVLEEILIITYERKFDIFRSINAASNGFKLRPVPAYRQAGVSIGRVVAAVIDPPS